MSQHGTIHPETVYVPVVDPEQAYVADEKLLSHSDRHYSHEKILLFSKRKDKSSISGLYSVQFV